MDIAEPRFRKSHTLAAEPQRAKERTDKLLPSDTKSSVESPLPKRAMPSTLVDEPSRAKERSERLDPRYTQSRVDNEDPKRVAP